MRVEIRKIGDSLGGGLEADRLGYKSPERDKVLLMTETHIVIKSKGYAENPGSRNSGLKSYYPGEVMILEIVRRLSRERRIFEVKEILSWSTARSGKAILPEIWA